jgi:curved DNA-binding protein
MFNQSGNRAGRGTNTRFKGQDFTTELHLSLKEAYTSHKRTLNINGKSIRITIAAGVENGQVIKISGYGGEGISGGPKGDLYITFSIENDADFKRDKNNLYTSVSLPLYTAVLGGEITVNTFDGKVKLNIAAGTQNNAKVKLKGKGFPIYKNEGTFGDLYITYQITIPTQLSDKEKELFTELSKIATT